MNEKFKRQVAKHQEHLLANIGPLKIYTAAWRCCVPQAVILMQQIMIEHALPCVHPKLTYDAALSKSICISHATLLASNQPVF